LPFHQVSATILQRLVYLAQPLKNFQSQPYRIWVCQSNWLLA